MCWWAQCEWAQPVALAHRVTRFPRDLRHLTNYKNYPSRLQIVSFDRPLPLYGCHRCFAADVACVLPENFALDEENV